MYAIAHVIHGIPLTAKVSDLIEEWELMEGESPWYEGKDNTTCGFKILYSGDCDHQVGYCGVELATLDEGKIVDLSSPEFKPTEPQMRRAKEKIDKLHPELVKIAEPVGNYIVWSTS